MQKAEKPEKKRRRPYKKRKKRISPRIVRHHISYDPEETVRIYDGEHMILTRLGWRKKHSQGFIVALLRHIDEMVDQALDLDMEDIDVDHRVNIDRMTDVKTDIDIKRKSGLMKEPSSEEIQGLKFRPGEKLIDSITGEEVEVIAGKRAFAQI